MLCTPDTLYLVLERVHGCELFDAIADAASAPGGALAVSLVRPLLAQLFAALDADGDGRVSYAEFAAFVGGSSREPAGLDELRASLRKQLRKKRRGGRFSRATPVDVCMVLGARDEEKTGRLERAVFNKTLARAPLSLKFEGGQAATLTRKFRVHEDGVDYVAFAKWLGPKEVMYSAQHFFLQCAAIASIAMVSTAIVSIKP